MKTYVFGGTGFIGKHLVNKLVSLGHEVILVKHDTPYTITEADYIFYLASYGNHFNQKDKFETVKANILDLVELLRTTKDINYKAFIHISTSSVTLPIQTLYSDTKAVAEVLCKRYVRKYKKPIVSIRPSSVYGPGEAEFRFIPTIIKNLGKSMPFTEGMHDWIYIDDFIEGTLQVVDHIQKLSGKSIPIGTGKQTSNSKVVESLIDISDSSIDLIKSKSVERPYDTKNWVADTTIMRSLGFEPKYSLREGLRKTYGTLK
jgi:nucleoside-diphosphate-sugar epimerase